MPHRSIASIGKVRFGRVKLLRTNLWLKGGYQKRLLSNCVAEVMMLRLVMIGQKAACLLYLLRTMVLAGFFGPPLIHVACKDMQWVANQNNS